MQSTHSTVLNTLLRVQRFMDTNAAALGSLNQSGYRHILDEVVETLGNHAVTQQRSKQVGSGETAKQRVLRNALKLNHMRSIAAVASAQLKLVPEFAAFKMPPGNATSRTLIAYAGAMGGAAEQYAQTFVAAGLPSDFLDQLKTATEALKESITNRGVTQTVQSGATAGLAAEAARGREALRVLDSLIEPQLAGDQVLLVQWKAAKRFGGKTLAVPSTTIDAAANGPNVPSASPPPSAPTPIAPSASSSPPAASSPAPAAA